MKHASLFSAAMLFALAQLAHSPAQAADTTPPPPPPPPRPAPTAASPADAAVPPYGTLGASHPLASAQQLLRASRWVVAIEELKRVNMPGDADWNNLMGYALRKQPTPDLDGAQRHYDAALRLNPQHQGALEYAGELALMKKDLATAEANLAKLQALCKSPCGPLDDLAKAVARFKATGS